MVGGPDCASELSSQEIQTMDKLSSLGIIHNPVQHKLQVGSALLKLKIQFCRTNLPKAEAHVKDN